MPSRGQAQRIREENLRLAAAVADIEGLYTALLRATGPAARLRLLADLAVAGRRLARIAALPGDRRHAPVLSRSRRRRRRALAARGADWIVARFADPDGSDRR